MYSAVYRYIAVSIHIYICLYISCIYIYMYNKHNYASPLALFLCHSRMRPRPPTTSRKTYRNRNRNRKKLSREQCFSPSRFRIRDHVRFNLFEFVYRSHYGLSRHVTRNYDDCCDYTTMTRFCVKGCRLFYRMYIIPTHCTHLSCIMFVSTGNR